MALPVRGAPTCEMSLNDDEPLAIMVFSGKLSISIFSPQPILEIL